MYMHVCKGLEPVRLSNPILKATLEGIGRSLGKGQNGKDPLLPEDLVKLSNVVDLQSGWEVMLFTCILFLFRTLLRVSHVVTSKHTLLKSDVTFNDKGFLVRVVSSKTLKKGDEIVYLPVVFAKIKSVCAVSWLVRFLHQVPKLDGEPLFSFEGKGLTYNSFSRGLSKLLLRAGVVGNFASHSLRRGGATHMSMSGCSVAEVKERGRWKSNCVFMYIRQPLAYKIKVEEKVARKG